MPNNQAQGWFQGQTRLQILITAMNQAGFTAGSRGCTESELRKTSTLWQQAYEQKVIRENKNHNAFVRATGLCWERHSIVPISGEAVVSPFEKVSDKPRRYRLRHTAKRQTNPPQDQTVSDDPRFGARVYKFDQNNGKVYQTIHPGPQGYPEYVLDRGGRAYRFVALDNDAQVAQAIRDALNGNL